MRLENVYDSAAGAVRWNRLGDGDGHPLVFLHGTPFSSAIWRHVAPALAHHHPVYVWDMPGYGLSQRFAGQDLSLDALSRIFGELLDHWRLSEPLVVAHDSGGAIALGATVLQGVRYRRLALVDAVAIAPWGSPFFRGTGDHGEMLAGLSPEINRTLIREYVNSASSPGLHPATLDALAAPWLADGGQAFYRQLEQRRDDERFTGRLQDRYGTIDVPVLVCWGADDTWVPEERGKELAARIPGATFRSIPDAGHLVMEDNPAALTAALLAFLHDLDGT